MIRVTIEYRRKQTVIICDAVSAHTNREVTCFWYAGEGKVEDFKGRIIRVEYT